MDNYGKELEHSTSILFQEKRLNPVRVRDEDRFVWTYGATTTLLNKQAEVYSKRVKLAIVQMSQVIEAEATGT